MKSYLNYFKLNFLVSLQYRADIIAGVLTSIFFGLIFVMVYLSFYRSNPGEGVMDIQNLVNYVWLQQIFYSLVFPFTRDHELLKIIKNGNLAYELVRPQNFFLKYYAKMLAKKCGGVFLRGGIVLVVACLLPHPFGMTAPVSIEGFFLFVAALIFSCLLVSSFTVIVHILTMFTIDSKGIINIYIALAEIFMGIIVPLPFFPKWLENIANYLPFRFIGDFPFRAYSGDISYTFGIELLKGSGIWIIISIVFGLILSKKALKKAVIQGG